MLYNKYNVKMYTTELCGSKCLFFFIHFNCSCDAQQSHFQL